MASCTCIRNGGTRPCRLSIVATLSASSVLLKVRARARVWYNLSKIDLFMLAIMHRGAPIAYRRSRNLSEVAR
jgi:hypothetical protein